MPRPWPATPPSADDRASYREATPHSYWLDALDEPPAAPTVQGAQRADLCIVGGGFTGLWAALHAKRDDPSRDVMLVEGGRIGEAASGRNGGFCVASLTHGVGNGEARFPDELALLDRLGRENYDGLVADLERFGIDCDFEEVGELTVALEPHQVEWLAEEAQALRGLGHDVELLDGDAMRADVASPTYVGGVWDRTGAAILHPGKLVAGLRVAAVRAGVRLHEGSPVRRIETVGDAVRLHVGGEATRSRRGRQPAPNAGPQPGTIDARRVILATGAHRSLVRGVRSRIAPVYDYVLMTEPLTPEQLAAVGWSRRQGIGDSANQFHYYRLTADHRILWGGYDAVYRFGGAVDGSRDEHDESFARLAQHFFTTFPQLRGLRFTHRWGGAIDTCSRFSVFFGTTHRGRVSFVAGYTGLGVCATRFGGQVALDLVDGRRTEATATRYVRSKPLPFPPEPIRTAAIAVTQRQLEAADASAGTRGVWLRTLDRLGLGFDS